MKITSEYFESEMGKGQQLQVGFLLCIGVT